jgi:glutamate racemase
LFWEDVPPYLIPQIKILPHAIHIDSGRPLAKQTKNMLENKIGFSNGIDKTPIFFIPIMLSKLSAKETL